MQVHQVRNVVVPAKRLVTMYELVKRMCKWLVNESPSYFNMN